MAWGALAAGLGGAVLSGIAGAQGSKKRGVSTVQVADESALERLAGTTITDQLGGLQGMVNAGPGQGDVSAAVNSQRALADLLSQYQQGGFQPGNQDFISAQNLAQNVFAPQQQQMLQGFQDEDQELRRMAALMGRSPNDPVLRNKLAQTRGRQQSQLGAQQTSFIAQQAQAMPMQRLGFAQQHAQVLGGLATQAMANREALLRMGQGIKAQEQNFRLGTATRSESGTAGGGLAGAISGGMAGFGAFTGAYNNMAGMFSAAPAAPAVTAAPMPEYVGQGTNTGSVQAARGSTVSAF